MEIYLLDDGALLVKAARSAIELSISSPKFRYEMIQEHLEKFTGRHGVFVTIEHYPTMNLRGCIGFPRPTDQLRKLLPLAAVSAATEDPRFNVLSLTELNDVVIEVSILSQPQKIAAKTEEDIKSQIKIGRDGLVIEYGSSSALFLPVVPVEQGWTKDEYLENLCEKAGIPNNAWKSGQANLYKFTAQTFKEKSPKGKIEEIKAE